MKNAFITWCIALAAAALPCLGQATATGVSPTTAPTAEAAPVQTPVPTPVPTPAPSPVPAPGPSPVPSPAPAPGPAPVPTTAAAARPVNLTVAILDFAADVPGNSGLGKQIGETLTATMGGDPGFTLVDRATLDRTLQEHELNLTGLVNPDDAIKIGHLVGARILITGKAFALDRSMFITAKLVGTETGLVSGVVVKGKLDSDLGDLLNQLSDKIIARLHDTGQSLVLQPDATPDRMIALKAKLATLSLPKIAIMATDQHIGPPLLRAIDPPVDNTLRTMLTQAGFDVIDKDAASLTQSRAEWAVKAEGFSEFGARIGNLVTCTARVELSVEDLANTKTIFSDSFTARSTDLSEDIAGKTALESATHELGLRMLQHAADTLPPAANRPPGSTAPKASATQSTLKI